MSAQTETRIFGLKVGVDPKWLVAGLLLLAGAIYWFNSRDDHETGTPAAVNQTTQSAVEGANPAPVTTARSRGRNGRRRTGRDDRGTLRLQNVTPANGDIDPVLRLDLLDRLAKVEMPKAMRNLFESGPAAEIKDDTALPVRTIVPAPIQPTQPIATVAPLPAAPQVNIPFKYYGFARPSIAGEANRGFFLEGDDVLVAAEGQVLRQRYRVVQLTGTTAKLEDTQINIAQTLPVMPEAIDQGSMGYGRPGIPNQGPAFANQQEDVGQP